MRNENPRRSGADDNQTGFSRTYRNCFDNMTLHPQWMPCFSLIIGSEQSTALCSGIHDILVMWVNSQAAHIRAFEQKLD